MNPKTARLLRLAALPLTMGACGLTAALLAAAVQSLSGDHIGSGGFGVPTIIGALIGTISSMARLLTEERL